MFDAFNEIFESKLSDRMLRYESFELASAEFLVKYGYTPYKNVESFMNVRSRRRRTISKPTGGGSSFQSM